MTPAVDAVKAHRFAPRRNLPNGRAVVGALLVTVAMTGTFALATGGATGPTTEYLVVVDDIEAGETIDLSDVALEVMELSPGAATYALQSTSGLEGATALNRLHEGSIVDVRDLNGAAFIDGRPVTGVHELTIPVPADRAPETMRRGDRVTVLAYAGVDGVLHTAIEDALVLEFTNDPSSLGASDEARLTLGLSDADDVASLALWSYQALTIVLTTRVLDDVYAPQIAPSTTSTPVESTTLDVS